MDRKEWEEFIRGLSVGPDLEGARALGRIIADADLPASLERHYANLGMMFSAIRGIAESARGLGEITRAAAIYAAGEMTPTEVFKAAAMLGQPVRAFIPDEGITDKVVEAPDLCM